MLSYCAAQDPCEVISLWLGHQTWYESASLVAIAASVHMRWAPQHPPFSESVLGDTCPVVYAGARAGKLPRQEGDQSGGPEWCLRQATHGQLLTLANIQHSKSSPFHLQLLLKMWGENIILQNLDLEPGSGGQFPISKRGPAIPLPEALLCRLKPGRWTQSSPLSQLPEAQEHCCTPR